MAQDPGKKLKTALDETRLLILGAQILLGFHLNAAFQVGFMQLSPAAQAAHAFAFLTMVLAVGLLIAPSLQHRIAERGQTSRRMLCAATRFADIALLPLAVGLAADISIVVSFRLGSAAGLGLGLGLGALALLLWYGAEWACRLLLTTPKEGPMGAAGPTPLDERIEHMLTETRVLIPGGQALFGFQLAIFLTEAFGRLPPLIQALHTVALTCIAPAVILLMAPAAFHRITWRGENTERFHRLGSALIVASAVPLALGIASDLSVAVTVALGAQAGVLAGGTAGLALLVLWFAVPLALRRRKPG